ncbi:heavy-metal-associated domain-containing protein [Mycolicibacterium sp. 3033]|nr:heavy-metal-associated domain-containing protein [Mycolicibacterium aurantiacum]
MNAKTYHVIGMTCGHCERSVREEVGDVPGIRSVDVDAQSGTLVVSSDESVDDALIVKAVGEAGYSASAWRDRGRP